jgi:hypothetical protein
LPWNSTPWNTRTLAAELSTSHSMVDRVWQVNGIMPHPIKTFKLSQ